MSSNQILWLIILCLYRKIQVEEVEEEEFADKIFCYILYIFCEEAKAKAIKYSKKERLTKEFLLLNTYKF